MNNRTKGNDTLRKRLKIFLKKIKSGNTIHINHVVMELSRLNKNYSISTQRAASLLKEHDNLVTFVKSGVWLKL